MRARSGRGYVVSLVAAVVPAIAAVSMAWAQGAAPPRATPPATGPIGPVAPAAPSAPKAPQKVRTVEGITEYRLDNGLRVLLFPDASKPTLTVNATYFVGSRHEGYGESGMAHLLEHMLFKGTPKHPEPWKDLQDHGAQFNGSTSFDRTNYFEVVPATPENLDYFLAFEADRMVNCHVDAKDLAKEFSVVRNEFEMGENNPDGVLIERMMSAAYLWHNYGKSTIGSRVDIERVPIENLKAFYKRFYQPDNAMLVLAGKFDPVKALALVGKHFGGLPRPARKLAPTYTVEPVQDGERTVTLRRTGDVGIVGLVYHGVAGPDPDFVAEEALMDILANRPSGRLYKALVDKGLASEVDGGVDPVAEPGVMTLMAKLRAGQSVDKVRDVMTSLVEGFAATKVTDDEVQRFKTRVLKDIELGLTDADRIGIELSEWGAMGDWRLLFLHRDRVEKLTAADVTRVAKAFLKPSNRTLGLFQPTKAPDRAPPVQTPDATAMVKDYAGRAAVAQGEVFAATVDNVEKRTTRFALPSGMKVALLPKKTRGGAVKAVLTLHFGAEKDLKGKTAAAQIIPQMLMRGSKKHSYQQLKDEFDRLKADVQLGQGGFSIASPGAAFLSVTTTRDNLPAVLDLLVEVLREPAFPKAELEVMRKEALAQLEEQLQNPPMLAFTTLAQRVAPYPKDDVRYHPSVAESIERLKAVKLADLQKMHKELWGGSRAELAVVGDFDGEATRRHIEARLGDWKSPKPYAHIAQPFKPSAASDDRIDTPDKQMAFIGVAHAIEERDDDPDYPALILLNHLLGASANSRLFLRLRQKDGVSYGAFSAIAADAEDRNGLFFAGAICAPQNADKAMTALGEEVAAILKDGIPEKEIADGKKSYAQQWDTQMAQDDFVAAQLAQGLYLGRTLDYWKALNARIDALTAADVVAAARKHVQPARFVKVRAGDFKAAAAPAPAGQAGKKN